MTSQQSILRESPLQGILDFYTQNDKRREDRESTINSYVFLPGMTHFSLVYFSLAEVRNIAMLNFKGTDKCNHPVSYEERKQEILLTIMTQEVSNQQQLLKRSFNIKYLHATLIHRSETISY